LIWSVALLVFWTITGRLVPPLPVCTLPKLKLAGLKRTAGLPVLGLEELAVPPPHPVRKRATNSVAIGRRMTGITL